MQLSRILSLFLIVFSSVLSAQGVNGHLGNWIFDDFPDRASYDIEKQTTLEEIFVGMFINFSPDGTYKAGMMGQKDEGTWESAETSVIMQSNKAVNPLELKGLVMQGKTMQFTMINTEIRMKRAVTRRDNTPPPPPPPPVYTSVKPEEIMGKWNLEIRYTDQMTDKQKDLSRSLSKDAYFSFKSNGKFKSELLGIKDKGTWKLTEDNTAFEISGVDVTTKWFVEKVNTDTLILIKDKLGYRWEFSKAD
jgi:hypothetical protein